MADEPLAATPVETTVAPVVETPTETPATETVETTETEAGSEAPAEATEKAETDEQPDKPKIPGSQRLKNRLKLIEADYEAERSARSELERRLAQFQTPQNEQGRPGIDREPKETDFPNDYFAFQDAKTSWNARQAVREEFARVHQTEKERSTERERREARAEAQEAYAESATTARERIPDFDKVIASAADVKITNEELVEEIMASPKAALIHYHLAQNREKARELNALRGKELAREVGRLEQSLHLPQAKKVTTASAPLSKPNGGAAHPVNLETADMRTFVKLREEQEKRRSS